jgi:hypothetical protein
MRSVLCVAAVLCWLLAPWAALTSGAVAVPRSPVWDIVPTWDAPPLVFPNQPVPDAPLLGNGGKLGVVVGSRPLGDQLTFYLAKNDFWAAPISGFSHLGYGDGGLRQVGGLRVTIPAFDSGLAQQRAHEPTQATTTTTTASSTPFTAYQFMGNASVKVVQRYDWTVTSESFVAPDVNLMVTSLDFVKPAAPTKLAAAAAAAALVNVTVWLPAGGQLPSSTGYVLADGRTFSLRPGQHAADGYVPVSTTLQRAVVLTSHRVRVCGRVFVVCRVSCVCVSCVPPYLIGVGLSRNGRIRLDEKQAAQVESVFVTRTNGSPYQVLPNAKQPKPFLNTAAIACRCLLPPSPL